MRKFLTALGLAALLSLPFGTQSEVQAFVVESTETDDLLNVAGEVTSTVTATPFTTLSIFLNGTYSLEARIWLQREAGSPGSGAWQNVMRIDTGVADATVKTAWTTGPNTESYRVTVVTAPTSGAVLVQMTNQQVTPDYAEFRPYQGTTWVNYIYDFNDFWRDEALDSAGANAVHGYIVGADDDGASGGAVPLIVATDSEGTIDLIGDADADEADGTCLSQGITIANQSTLVSEGRTFMTGRFSVNSLTTYMAGAVLTDVVCVATLNLINVFDAAANVIAEAAGGSDAVGFHWQSNADDIDGLNPVSVNGDTVGNNADMMEGGTLVVDDYVTIHIEVDATGDCYFYVDDVLTYAENQCVATTATLLPMYYINGLDATTTVAIMTLDYVEFAFPRPTAQ